MIEEREIKKDKRNKIKLSEAVAWYLNLNAVKAKKSYNRDKQLLENIKRLIGPNTVIGKIRYGTLEEYKVARLKEKQSTVKTDM